MPFWALEHEPEILRKSSAIRRCRDRGFPEVADEIERLAEQFQDCPVHGPMEDPIIALAANNQLAVACPHCSDPDVLAAWEAEGKRGVS